MQKVISPKLVIVGIITLICIYLTYPTFRYFFAVSSAGGHATAEEQAKIDELRDKGRVIKLGLDLQGGVDFLLAVDTDLLKRRSIENDAEAIRSAFGNDEVDARVAVDSKDAANLSVTITLNDPAGAKIASETLKDLMDRESVHLKAESGNAVAQLAEGKEVKLVPDQARFNTIVGQAMEGALRVVKDRLDKFGLTQPLVTRAGSDRIKVQVPGESDPDRLRDSLLKTASLEFRLVHPQHRTEIAQFVEGGANGLLPNEITGHARKDLIETIPSPMDAKETVKKLKDNIPGVPAGYVLRLGRRNFIDPTTMQVDRSKSIDDLIYMVRSDVPLGGERLRRAVVYTDPTELSDPVMVSITFDNEGGRIFKDITTDHTGESFAIILDDVVYSAPNIREPIVGGSASISGGFSQSEAQDLAVVLKAGALPAPLRVISQNTIGPTLGADSIRDSGKAVIIGGILIIIMMVSIYRTAGFVAVLAMVLNVLLIMAILSLMNATLTLSGIGGILLTMGMAVDANILIYERLREELRGGKPMRAAINIAFDRVFTVILDSHITALLPALVLVLFEIVDGSMKGFWLAISIGLIANMYTGIVVSRALIEAYYNKFKAISVGTWHLLHGVTVQWMKFRWVGLVFSVALTVLSIGVIAVKGPGFGVDFTGGVLVTVETTKPTTQAELLKLFEEDFRDTRVIKIMNKEQWQVTVPLLENKKTGVAPTLEEARATVLSRIEKAYGDSAKVVGTSAVDAFVGDDFKLVAILSLIVTCVVILGFLALRFQWIFGLGAVLALVHDVFLSVGVFRLLGHSVTLDVVSALLIILGYSVNDTIVVFDRIREDMQKRATANVFDVINTAINETLSRTMLTSVSTMLAIAVMYFFGGAGLTDFALILLLGVAFGTYSSVFVATGMVYIYLEKRGVAQIFGAKKATARIAPTKAKA
ncbi:protein translocase subunit SecD [Candidatus Sumerlaeota bacterium]|nr:protein translocase subunit SecD [Candidatus Sumerlaeota bacterium]